MTLANLNPFAISGLLIVITYAPLFLLILVKEKTWLTRIFSMHILSVLLWGAGSFLIGISTDIKNATTIWQFAYISVIFIPVFFYHSAFLVSKTQKNFLVFLAYAQAVCFSLYALNKEMFPSCRLFFNSFFYIGSGPIFFLSFIAWTTLASMAHLKLINYYQHTYPDERKQILFLLISAIGFVGGMMNFLPTFGLNIYPYGNFLIPIHSLLISYAILKHQFLDISLVFKKSFIYSILIATITLTYLIIIFLFERLLQEFVGYKSLFVSIITAFTIGLIFIPLRNKIQYIVDRFFFKGTQAEIARQNELLREQVAQAERLKTVATLASGIAHEIKNPLTAINTFTEKLPEKKDDKEFLDKFSRIVGHEVNRIDNLVHQLLDFAKPSPLTLSDVDLYKFLDDTIDLLSHQLIKNHIKVAKDFCGTCAIRADANQLRQAFLNILLNALEAMPSGGTLDIQTINDGERIIIDIADSGEGISEKDLKHIFDPFFTTKDHGTGLGLSITQRIIQDHGGKILIDSRIGKGTTVRIELGLKKNES